MAMSRNNRDYSLGEVVETRKQIRRRSPFNSLWAQIVELVPESDEGETINAVPIQVVDQADATRLRSGLKRAAKAAGQKMGCQLVGSDWPKVLQVWRPKDKKDETKVA